MGRGVLAVAALAAGCLVPSARATAAPDRGDACGGPQPFAGIPGAELTSKTYESKDDDPVRYVLWSGFVPSFDGLPLSVDVTVPCANEGDDPLVVMPHGFTDDKTVWEETGKSDMVDSKDRPGANSHWNNIWFASRGYTVLTYTARGWHDSCGPDTPGHSAEKPAPRCAGHEWWIHLDDQRWEVRDAQWLTGALVQSGTADPQRLAITGGSYGGGPTSMGALLGDRVVCGGDPIPAELGVDACEGKADGEYAPWQTPDGKQVLTWAAALPLYTFGDLVQVLAPNGRWSDETPGAPALGSPTEPFGVPLESTLKGLMLAATVYGGLAPPGTDPTSDIRASSDRLLEGNPFDPEEAVVRDGVEQYQRFKSPVGIELESRAARVPIFWVQGLTDALFPAHQALIAAQHIRGQDPDYPVKLFFGDFGHDYAAERRDEWDLAHQQMNDFLDHYLDPKRTPTEPTFDTAATVTRCLDHDAPMTVLRAADWAGLEAGRADFRSTSVGHTSTREIGPNGELTDPISTATLPGPKSYKGCRIISSKTPDPTVATYTFPVTEDLTMMGGPVVDLTLDTTGDETPIAVRVWDVDPKTRKMGLVTRGIHRMALSTGKNLRVKFQLFPQGYRFPKGHELRVEVTGNDAPTFQTSSITADITIHEFDITIPKANQAAAPRLVEGGEDAYGCQKGADGVTCPSRTPSRETAFRGAYIAVGVFFGGLVIVALLMLRTRRRG